MLYLIMPQKGFSKVPLWLPYLSEIRLYPTGVRFVYKGGKVRIEYKAIHSIMIYGKHPPLPQEFLENCARYKIPIVIHRRNMIRAVWITPNFTSGRVDLLTPQILFRENQKKRLHIAKRLLIAKFRSMQWLVAPPSLNILRINDLDRLRQIEANHARRYWDTYYRLLGSDASRRQKGNIITQVLDAYSKFVSSIILRWIHFHNLSPYHGYLHEPTDYPSLVYDFFEPLRGYFDKIVFDTLRKHKKENLTDEGITGKVINAIKEFFEKKTYVHSTKQIVTMHELLHGIVLAFRAYLLGDSYRFIVPIPAKPKTGRPIKAGFVLYGHKAGVIDYFGIAKQIASSFEEEYTPKFLREGE